MGISQLCFSLGLCGQMVGGVYVSVDRDVSWMETLYVYLQCTASCSCEVVVLSIATLMAQLGKLRHRAFGSTSQNHRINGKDRLGCWFPNPRSYPLLCCPSIKKHLCPYTSCLFCSSRLASLLWNKYAMNNVCTWLTVRHALLAVLEGRQLCVMASIGTSSSRRFCEWNLELLKDQF